ncbi:MAG: HEAT repeat domain-containing protein [Planctomycetota bacterium]
MPRPAALLLALTGALLPGCSSTPEKAPDKLAGLQFEPYQPEPPRSPLFTGELILACEQHLRVWNAAMNQQRSEKNAEAIQFTERALAILVQRERARLENQAVSGPPQNRGVASAALAFSGDSKVLPLILNNLKDPDRKVRANALLGIGVLADRDTPLAPIYEALSGPEVSDAVVANGAFAALQLARVLQEDPSGNLSSILGPMLTSSRAAIRAQAATGLGLIRASHLLPKLNVLVLADPDPSVRTAAAFALGEIGALGSADPLIQALEDKDKITAGTARGALAKIFGTDHGPDPDSWREAQKKG